VIVVILHGVLLWRQRIDYLCFLPAGKEEKLPMDAYNSLTALNIPARQNLMNESTKGSP
jgi:hypothetical protein